MGVTPLASASTKIGTRLVASWKSAVSVTASGTTRRGKRIFRSSPSRDSIDCTEPVVACRKKVHRMIASSSSTL